MFFFFQLEFLQISLGLIYHTSFFYLIFFDFQAEWVVSIVQLLSLVFKDYAGSLLEEIGEEDAKSFDSEYKSDQEGYSSSDDIVEFMPSQSSRVLSRTFNKQLQIGDAVITVQASLSRSNSSGSPRGSPTLVGQDGGNVQGCIVNDKQHRVSPVHSHNALCDQNGHFHHQNAVQSDHEKNILENNCKNQGFVNPNFVKPLVKNGSKSSKSCSSQKVIPHGQGVFCSHPSDSSYRQDGIKHPTFSHPNCVTNKHHLSVDNEMDMDESSKMISGNQNQKIGILIYANI